MSFRKKLSAVTSAFGELVKKLIHVKVRFSIVFPSLFKAEHTLTMGLES